MGPTGTGVGRPGVPAWALGAVEGPLADDVPPAAAAGIDGAPDVALVGGPDWEDGKPCAGAKSAPAIDTSRPAKMRPATEGRGMLIELCSSILFFVDCLDKINLVRIGLVRIGLVRIGNELPEKVLYLNGCTEVPLRFSIF